MSFENLNKCHSFQMLASGTTKQLSSFECSEAIVLNNSGSNLSILTPGDELFIIPTLQQFTFRGISNSDNLSAAGSGNFSVRTQFYSYYPQM